MQKLKQWCAEILWRIHERRLRRKEDEGLAEKKEKFKQALMDPSVKVDGYLAAKTHMFGGRPKEPKGEWSAKFLTEQCFAKDELKIESARKEREQKKNLYIDDIVHMIESSPVSSITEYGLGWGLPDLSTRFSVGAEEKRRRKAAQGNVSIAEPTQEGALTPVDTTDAALSEIDKKNKS